MCHILLKRHLWNIVKIWIARKTLRALESGYSVLRIHCDDIKYIKSILTVVMKQSKTPILYVSREGVYDYLGVNGKFPIKIYDQSTEQILAPIKRLTLNVIQS